MTNLDKRLKYQSDEEKPVTISMRLPKELHSRLEQYASEHRQSISELVRDGLEWRLSDGDPRGLGATRTQETEEYYMSNTAHALADMRQAFARQEAHLQAIVEALGERSQPVAASATPPVADISHDSNAGIQDVQKRRGRQEKESPSQDVQRPVLAEDPAPAAPTQNGNTSLQEAATQPRGRKPVLREPILALLREYPGGLTAAQLKVYLSTEKPIGDTLSGMVKAELLVKDGSGKAVRYLLADGVEAPSRP
jgi:hypothetical protein